MESKPVFRKGKLVYLRPLSSALHAETALGWMNNQKVTEFLMRVYPMTLRQEIEWMDNQGKDQKDVALAIHKIEDDTYIGNIGLHQIDLIDRNAVTGTVIGDKESQGKGFGTDAKMLLLDFAFNELGLEVILSKVIAFNDRSLAYGKKCGYEEVGRLPKWIYRHGERHDEILLTVTRERWLPLWEKYRESMGK